MPLDEEGAKWSCEPCIRGHRSSKCQHFDRLMMKVPKAGRPLAKCPHPNGSCSCQKIYALMVRIPKGSTCLCRPLYKVPASVSDSGQSTSQTSVAPISSPGSGKVQKSVKRQSSLQAAPENIAKALNFMPGPKNQHVENGASSHRAPYPSGFANGYGNSNSVYDASPMIAPPQTAGTNGVTTPKAGNCCSRKSPPVQPDQKQKSCCGKSSRPLQSNTNQAKIKVEDNSNLGLVGMPYAPFSAPQTPSWQDFSNAQYSQPFALHQSQPQTPAYMNGYVPESTSTPLMGYSYLGFSPGADFSHNAMQPFTTYNPQAFTYTPPPTLGGDPAHECSCGDDCQCLGCASHPYNNTTRQHVQEMGFMVAIDGQADGSEISNGYHNTHFPEQAVASTSSYRFQDLGSSVNNTTQPETMPSYSAANFNTGFSSPLSPDHGAAQQLMEPSEYYTIEYPVGLPNACSDMTGSCQCGSDCSCIGCLTHSGHNGLALEPGAADNTPLSKTEFPASHLEQSNSEAARVPVSDALSMPSILSLSPRAIESQAT